MNKLKWMPAILMGVGAALTVGIDGQREMALADDLADMVSGSLAGYTFSDIELSEAEKTAAGFTDYVLRDYNGSEESGLLGYSLYLGYYASQSQGSSIHSPKNCLPGSGWEALASTVIPVTVAGSPINVNRYVVQNGASQALVLYWYQGRGRIEANEYRVKWNLLADAALRSRTEETLVRIVVPLPLETETPGDVEALATRVAEQIIPELNSALPG
jgi:EpsI family protein